MKNILITGGTGLIGKNLSKKLSQKGYNIFLLSHSSTEKTNGYQTFYWNIEQQYIDPKVFEQKIDIIVHLAGANISEHRWTKKYKEKIRNSRIKSLQLLYQEIKDGKFTPNYIVSSSAIGYYGSFTSEVILNENSPPGNDFLAQVCKDWESSALKFRSLGIKTGIIRTGVVLSEEGGIFRRLYPLAKLGLISSPGSGNQYLPWIHINDIIGIYTYFIENQIDDIVNGVAPNFIHFKDFVEVLISSMNKKNWLPSIPSFVIKILYGEMSCILLYGSRVSAEKIQSLGYNFEFMDISMAVKDLVLKLNFLS